LKAPADADSALKINPKNYKAYYIRGLVKPTLNNQEIKLDLKESFEDTALAFIKRGDFSNAAKSFGQALELNEQLLKKDPENLDFSIARLRGEQIFADALLEKGEKGKAKEIYEKAIIFADTRAPKKFAEFAAKFKAEVNESLLKCL
jgi:tetratricopeptide (TPR) repeat protein